MKKVSRRRAKRSLLKKQVPAAGICLLSLGCPIVVLAAPVGGVVTVGSASISSSGVTTTINQASNKAAINWQSFGIAKGETVNFVQPSASSIALNRVVGSDASAIYGTLSANGQVFLINPNGILFAPGAQVNVAGLVASTLNISDSDFLSGNYRFSKDGKAGSVINQGDISANGGYVAFLGPQVKNEGIVAAKVIGMGAGDKVNLDFNGDSLLKLTVDTVAAGASASNSGSLLADGGTVLMSTGTKDALLSTVVNNSGLIQARTVNNISGTIILEGGTAHIGGTLDASAPNGGNGGFIETSGASVTMAPDLHVTTLAPQGQTGTWLIDPTDYTIGTGATTANYWNNADLGTALGSSNITVETAAGGSDSGDINILAPVSWSANTLTLSAYRNINVNATLTATGTSGLTMTSGTGGSGSIDYGLTASGFSGKVNFDRAGSGFLTINGSDYNVINSLADLQALTLNNSGVKYYLGADLDASDTSTWNGGAGFAPIGSSSGSSFDGVFDGGGHTIGNLTINRAGQGNVGLFGYTGWATLANLGLTNVNIGGGDYTGGLAGYMAWGGIHSSYVTGIVSGTAGNVGGLAGFLGGGTITNSYATAGVSSTYIYVGGLVGTVGESGNISASYATGSVSGEYGVGGLVGWLENGSVANSYATGSVTATAGSTNNLGSLVGMGSGASTSAITASYATGRLIGALAGDMGLVGGFSSATVTNGYWDRQTTGGDGTISGLGTGLTTAQLMSALPTGFSSDVWGIIPGSSYPYLKWNHPTTPQVVSGFVKNAGGATQAGQTVQTLANGNLVGSTSSGANGFYYMLLGNNSIADSKSVLSFVNTQGGTATFTTAANQNLTGFDITIGRVTVTHNDAINVTSVLGQAKGGNTDDTRYTVSGSNVSVNGDLYVTAAGEVVGDALAVSGATTVNAGANDISLNNASNDFTGAVTLTGNNVTLRDTNDLTLGAITAPGSITLTAGGNITANGAISTALFDLKGGNWQQVGALPAFSATDFRISGGSFLRALGGDGASGTPYQISDIYGLQGIGSSATLLTNHYSLANNIDASGTSGWNGGAGFKPIGSESSEFTGSFDGGGHTINGLTINRPGTNDVGLFAYTNGATLANVGLTNLNVSGAADVGGLVGENRSGSISNAYTTGSVSGLAGFKVGGLVGQNYGGSISNSYSTASVNGNATVGGLVGTLSNSGSISNSYATGSVTGSNNYVGGLVGFLEDGSVTNSYATGSVTGASYVGGLAGRLNGSITNSYATGSVSGSGEYVGGLTGWLNGSVAHSYWNIETSGQATSNGGTGLTTAQMKDAANYSSWDTAAVWYLNGSQTAPLLLSFLTPLTVSADSVSKVYDGTATAALTNVTAYDAAKVGGTLAWDGKNVGSYSLTGLYTTSQQGYLIDYDATALLAITPRALTASVTAASKVYDGTTAATISGGINLGNLIGGDTVSATYISGDFADKHVGDNKTVTLAGISLTGADAGNYSLAADSVTSSASITPKTLTITAVTDTKPYDGTTSSGGGPAVSGLVIGVGDTIDGLSQAFANKNVLGAGNSTLNVSGYTINDGNNGQNYTVITQSATGTITPKALTAALTGTAEKVYDGTTAATLTNANFHLFDLITGDAVSVSGTSASYADKNVDSLITVTATGLSISGADAGNYTISGDASGNIGVITPRALTGSVTAANKVYDRTTAATIDAGVTLGNLIDGDTVSASHAGGEFSDWNVGDNKTVNLSGISLTGADAGNYVLASSGIASNASITPATLTLTSLGTVEKVYDGTATAMVNAGNQPLLQGSFSGDNVALTFGTSSATYDNKNVGDNKTVTLSGLTLGGTDAGNYQLASTSISGDVGKITPAALTITASAGSKVYDGTTSSSAAPTYSGLMAGDSVSGLVQVYADKNAGSGKTLSVNGYILNDGNSGGNYTVTLQDNASGIITPAQLIYTAATVSREQDKDTPLLSGSIGGIASGDSLAAVTSGSLTWLTTATKSSPAGRYAITGSGLSVIDGNYLADILQAPGNAMALTVRAQQGGAGYQDLLPWIVQANHANGNRPPEGIGATAGNDASAPVVRHAARYAAGEASSGNVDGGAVFGLPLRIVGSGVNVGGHRTVAPLLQISTQEERKPHAL